MTLPFDPHYSEHVIWTEQEKVQLLEALQKHGAGDIAKLAPEVPTKTPLEILRKLGMYATRLRRDVQGEAEEDEENKTPIDSWLHFLKHKAPRQYKQLSGDIAVALKFLALFGKHVHTNDVDLRDCYEYLSAVTAGNKPRKLNDESMHFMMENCAKLIADLDKEDNSKHKEFIKNLTTHDILKKCYVSKNASVASNPALNVVKVPSQLLQLKEEK